MNKLKGMIYAHSLGDALGAPHEFRYQKKNYNGKLEHEIHIQRRFHPPLVYPPGTVTDDTEMAMALLSSIIDNEGYDRDDVVMRYMTWANSTSSIGVNTRKLFKNVKTLKGYKNRYAKLLEEEISQSNGSLMRAYPLLLVNNEKEDCELTNPCDVNVRCSEIYIKLLKHIYNEDDKDMTIEWLHTEVGTDVVGTAISQAIHRMPRDVRSIGKGWVVHPLYLTIYAYMHIDTFTEMYDWVIQQWGDTDTNAAIVGAVKGLELGYVALECEQSENLSIMIAANPDILGTKLNNIFESLSNTQ
jgi:ADP-ribosyl-[dinitrogen reductase] hydrolase